MPASKNPDRDNPFGAWVRRRRTDLLLTQEDLAERANISLRTLRNIESAQARIPRAHTVRSLELALEHAGPSTPEASPDGVTARPPAHLPPVVDSFAGRTEQLDRLSHLLMAAGTAQLCVISGMPGVGKTSLAVRWAHDRSADFPDGQLYVDLQGYGDDASLEPGGVLRGFLAALGVDVGADASVTDLTGLFRSTVRGKRLLVVLDNARDEGQLRPLLPAARGCVTVVTSRDQLGGLLTVEGARPLVLEPCSMDEARDVLAVRVGDDRVRAEPAAIDRIVERCAGLPLALAIVGARAALHPRFRLAVLASELADGAGFDTLGGADPASDIRSVFSWSYRRLAESAAQMFEVCGHLPAAVTSVEAAASAAGWSLRRARQALADLVRANLIVEEEPGLFTMHDLIRRYARDLPARVDHCDIRTRIADHYLRTAQIAAALLRPHRARRPSPPTSGSVPVDLSDDHQAIAWFDRQDPALRALIRTSDAIAGPLAHARAAYLERRARWPELADAGRIAFAAADRTDDLTVQVDALSMIGRAHTRLGNHDVAARHYEHALCLAKRVGEPGMLAVAHFDLAVLKDSQGDHAASLDHVTMAHHHYVCAGDEAGQAFSLNAMGWDCLQLGDHHAAMSRCRAAITLHRRHGNRHGEAATWDTLGLAQQMLGRNDDAVESFRSGLASVDETGDRDLEGTLLLRLGIACRAAGDDDAARDAWQQALTMADTDGVDAGRAAELRAYLLSI